MSDASGRLRLPTSIRGRFLLVVLFGAVVPLALIGVWLTRSVVRAGEALLRAELEHSVERVGAGVESRWTYRSGDLALLAGNEAAGRLLAGAPSAEPAHEDAQYLEALFASVATTIPSFEYRDAAGRVRWRSEEVPIDLMDGRRQAPASSHSGESMIVTRSVVSSSAPAPLGEVVARVDLAALVTIDASLRLPSGARLQVIDRQGQHSLLDEFVPDAVIGLDRFTAAGVEWLAVHRPLVEPPVTLVMAAPLAAYVEPFERTARLGMITLAVVALLALALSTWLTARLTASLGRLAVAADAVARGDLEHRVESEGADEVGRLARAFNSMTESLRRTLTELTKRQALAAVGEYAAALAHEVRNGLTAVRLDLQRAQEKARSETPDASLIDRALENVKRLDHTVSGSLRTARNSHAPLRRIDLRAVLESAAQKAEGAFGERGGSLDPIADGKAAWVLGDALALEQLFLNLLMNAAQAQPRGARAAITLNVETPELRAVVRDWGGGISADDLAHVLDPFFSTKANGTGLGLAIARQIAAAHGGSLRIESQPGEGTRVEVRLPQILSA